MSDCNCTFAQKMTGDGCLQCNPDYWIDSLESQVKELQEEKQAIKQRLIDTVMAERKSTEGLRQAEATSRIMFNAGLGKAVELIEKAFSESK